MKRENSYLMTSDELQILAAASGMHKLLMFQPGETIDRGRQIQAVFRLIKDGFFIQNDTALKAGPHLSPFLNIFTYASKVLVAHTADAESPPLCIYSNAEYDEFVVISPHGNKDDTYRLYIVNEGTLIEDLESLNYLPVLYDDPLILRKMSFDGLSQLPSSTAPPLDPTALLDLVGEDLISVFEQYSLSETSRLTSLIMFHSSPTWACAICSADKIWFSYYYKNIFSDWLKGTAK